MSIEVIAKITIEEDSFDSYTTLYGEHLEESMKKLNNDGISLVDYSVIHYESQEDKEMYFNYLMNFALKSDYSLENPSPLSFDEWKQKNNNK